MQRTKFLSLFTVILLVLVACQDQQTGAVNTAGETEEQSAATAEPAEENLTEITDMNQTEKPDYVQALAAVYGPPSQDGFGSAVFCRHLQQGSDLEGTAKEVYQYFVGDLWERWGEETWMAPWQEAYARPEGAANDIIAELRSIEDRSASSSVSMILNVVENAEAGTQALAEAYDTPEVQEVSVYNIGDGEAYSGLIVAGQRADGEAIFLIFLLD